jgi:hypothetical protein
MIGQVIGGLSLVEVIRLSVGIAGFIVGLGLIPVLAMVGPGKTIGQAVGSICWTAATLALGKSVIVETEDGNYEFRTVSDTQLVNGDEPLWSRFSKIRFAVGVERTAKQFGDLGHSEPPDGVSDGDTDAAADGGLLSSTRDGMPAWVPAVVSDAEQKVWVELPDYLKRLRTAADYEIAEAASRESLVEHGGDTSEYSPWVMLTGCLLFLGAGILLGLVVVG